MPKTVQVRFVEARFAVDADMSHLRRSSPLIKYIAKYPSMGGFSVLAQGADKFTLKKWKTLLATTSAVRPVDNMCAAVDAARKVDGFEQFGVYCKQRRLANQPMMMPAAEEPQVVEPMQPPVQKPPPVPAFLQANDVARKAYQDAARCWDARKRDMPPPIPSDYEADLDDMFPMARKNTTIQDIHALLQRGRALARQAALDHIQLLRRTDKLRDNMIPPCLRDASRMQMDDV